MREPPLGAKLGAEFLGTFWLVFGGCGSAVLAAKFLTDDGVQLGIGFLGVALAFGLTVLTGAYAFGHVSGGHFNPAVTIGLAVAKRFDWKGVLPYIVTQIVAASVAGAVLFVIAVGKADTTAAAVSESGFATNGYGDRSPGEYGLLACLITEVVLTAVFLYIILGATDDRAPKGFAPIAIGLGLTIIHLASIPVTNTSVNPARSTRRGLVRGRRRPLPGLAVHRRPDHRRRHRRCHLRRRHRRQAEQGRRRRRQQSVEHATLASRDRARARLVVARACSLTPSRWRRAIRVQLCAAALGRGRSHVQVGPFRPLCAQTARIARIGGCLVRCARRRPGSRGLARIARRRTEAE